VLSHNTRVASQGHLNGDEQCYVFVSETTRTVWERPAGQYRRRGAPGDRLLLGSTAVSGGRL